MNVARLTAISAVVALAAAPGFVGQAHAAAPADANAKPRVTVLAGALATPLSLAVADDGTRWFSQNSAGQLMRQRPGKSPTVFFSSPRQDEVGAVSIHRGVVTFAVSGHGAARLKRTTPSGRIRTVANLARYENRVNPDHTTAYGFDHLSASCARGVPSQVPVGYHGLIESHPFATTTIGSTTYVADAGGNDILGVRHGRIRTVAVLPPVPVVITKAIAHAAHLPACTIGKSYSVEAVPTDVERGPDGTLYVTNFPGGPEDGSFGKLGRVVRVNPRNGSVAVVADGIDSAIGLAVAHDGDIYVSELFANLIARIPHGTHAVRPFVRLPSPGDVESRGAGLLATDNVLTGGGGKLTGELVSIG